MENENTNLGFENKLYIARDIEGESNRDELEIIRVLEEKLSQDESFVGIAPFGSVVEGFSNDTSDIDLYILYDSSKKPNAEEDIKGLAEQCAQDIQKEKGKTLQILLTDVNPKLITEGIKKGIGRDALDPDATFYTADMTRVVTGEKINDYRNIIKPELQKLPQNDSKNFVRWMVSHLTKGDYLSIKRDIRLTEFNDDEHQ